MEASALRQAGRRGLLPRRSRLLKLQGDERLVALVREGNPSAFEAIVERYQGRLLGFCRQMLRSTEDAEDVLQEVFVNAYKAMMADNREINLRPWLYRIARNRCLNHLRKPTADARESMDMVPMVEAASTAETVHNREEFRQLLADVSKLPETQRTALLLREMDGLSYEEIAESMDTTVPSVKSLLVRARMSLSEASEARMLTCGEVRLALAEAAEGLSKISGPVRRHVRDCEECAGFRKQLKADSKAFAMIFPAGPLIALKAFLLAKFGGGAIAGGGSGACAAGGAGTGVAATGAACTAGGAAASGGAAVGGAAVAGGAAATAGLAGAAIGAGGGAMSSAIGAKALAGVVTAAVITAGAVEVKNTDKVVPETPAPKISTASSVSHSAHPAPARAVLAQPQETMAISAAVPAKSLAETEPVTPAEPDEATTVPADPVEEVPPVTEEEEQIGDAALIEHPAGTSDSTAHIGVGDGEGTPNVPVDPDGIVIVAPADGEGAVGPSGPSGPSGPAGPSDAGATPGTTPPPVTTPPPPVEPPPPPPATTPPPPVGPTPAPPAEPTDPSATDPAPAEQAVPTEPAPADPTEPAPAG